METAEELRALGLISDQHARDAANAAVALAALDELEALFLERHRVASVADSLRYALLMLRNKYAAKAVGGG